MIEAGGEDELERFVRELPDLLHRNTDLLSEAERMLMEEAESDSTLRAQHEARWNRTTSDKLTRDILCQCHQLQDHHQQCHPGRRRDEGEALHPHAGDEGTGWGRVCPCTAAPQLSWRFQLKGTNPDMKKVFLQAAANGALNEPVPSVQSLDRSFGPLQQQV